MAHLALKVGRQTVACNRDIRNRPPHASVR